MWVCCWLWSLCHTTQHRAVLIIFPLNLQTITITLMLSSGGEGAYYLRQIANVLPSISLSFFLFVSLLATSYKNYWSDIFMWTRKNRYFGRTVLCYILYHSWTQSQGYTHNSSSYSLTELQSGSGRLGLCVCCYFLTKLSLLWVSRLFVLAYFLSFLWVWLSVPVQ